MDPQERTDLFNFHLHQINTQCYAIWRNNIKSLLRDFLEFSHHFDYIYYFEDGVEFENSFYISYKEELETHKKDLDKYKSTTQALTKEIEIIREEVECITKKYNDEKYNHNKLKFENKILADEILELKSQLKKSQEDAKTTIGIKESQIKEKSKFLDKNIKENNKLKKLIKEKDETILCLEMASDNIKKQLQEKDKFNTRIKNSLVEEFRTTSDLDKYNKYVTNILKNLLNNLELYLNRVEFFDDDSSINHIVEEIFEMKKDNLLQVSPIKDFCGNTVYIFHNKNSMLDSKNLKIYYETILLSSKGFLYVYNETANGMVPLIVNGGKLAYVPKVKKIFKPNEIKNYFMEIPGN